MISCDVTEHESDVVVVAATDGDLPLDHRVEHREVADEHRGLAVDGLSDGGAVGRDVPGASAEAADRRVRFGRPRIEVDRGLGSQRRRERHDGDEGGNTVVHTPTMSRRSGLDGQCLVPGDGTRLSSQDAALR